MYCHLIAIQLIFYKLGEDTEDIDLYLPGFCCKCLAVGAGRSIDLDDIQIVASSLWSDKHRPNNNGGRLK